jgi:hydrophobe/amphiphile efflux-1 (HAE1) family protein
MRLYKKNMTLSDQSIKNPVMAWMILIGIIVFGAISYSGLGKSLMPDVDFPVLTVFVTWAGAAPDVVESQVTDVIEGTVIGIDGVTEVTSSSIRGASYITIQFDLSKNIDVALQQVQSALASAARDLPADIDPAIIRKSNPDASPIIWLSFSGNRPTQFLMEYTKNYLNDAFSSVPGVAQVSLGGYLNPSLRVWVDPKKMRAKEITTDDILNAIASGHDEVPAGFIDNGARETSIRLLGEAASVEEFSSIVIPSRRGMTIWKPIHIGDVARVEEGLEDALRLARTPDGLAVGIGILKQPGSNAVEVAHAVKKRVQELQKTLPEGTHLDMRFDTTKFIEDASNDMNFVIFLSIMLTAVVCWLFLGTFNTALNVSLTIPMSIFGAFFVIKLFGFTLNTFTFLGLSLVIGIVVDDAIMMVENISRHREAGETKIRAAIKGSREIIFAAIAATTAIIAIFLPVIFMPGVIGRYFFQFGVTISSAVLISLLGALTVTPMYASQYMPAPQTEKSKKPFMDVAMDYTRDAYSKMLKVCIENRWKVIIISLLVFFTSLVLVIFVKKEFVPAQDQGRLSINIQTAPGSAFEFTDEVFKKAEKIVADRPETDSYFSIIGYGSSNAGGIQVTFKDKRKRPQDPATHRVLTQMQIADVLRKQLKKVDGIRVVSMVDPSLQGFTAKRGFPVEFMLMGPDWDKLAELAAGMVSDMEKTGLMVDADSDYKLGVTEALVYPDRNKAAARGVNMSTIGNALNASYGGLKYGKYTKNGKRFDVTIELEKTDRTDIKGILDAFVRNNQGELIKLSDVVSVKEKPSVTSITRENRERAIRIYANVALGKSQGDAMKAVDDISKKLPEGYRIFYVGASQSFRDSNASLIIALILGIFVAYMVLGTQFNSFVHPISVLIALPFSVTGAFIALFLTGKTLNIYSFIGIILLMGIVKKNSILLVDFTNQRRAAGKNVRDALLEACPIRLRPILMTSAATIAAAIPPALALGPGSETRVPMAVVVIGGVFFSTLLTLFVVPCAYSLLSTLENKHHVEEVHLAMKELGEKEPEITGPKKKK